MRFLSDNLSGNRVHYLTKRVHALCVYVRMLIKSTLKQERMIDFYHDRYMAYR